MGIEPKLYRELASWFHLLTPPSEYTEEAASYLALFRENAQGALETLLELGSGGGNNAFHLKHYLRLTLVDRSDAMLAVSKSINPDCEHLLGDMRTVRVGRQFDAVFVHDATSYLTTEADLRATMETAYVHVRPGGIALFVPDDLRETFQAGTEHGGSDVGNRGIRFLEWSWDPDPDDSTYQVDFAYLLRESSGEVRVEHDRHICGLFARDQWLAAAESVGFQAQARPLEEVGEVFILKRQ